MDFKILCSDLDGTLLSTKNDVSEFTISEINRIKQKLRVILVSARMPKSMTYLQNRMGIQGNPIVCYNGALIMQNNNELSSTVILARVANEIYQACKLKNIKLGLYHKNEWFVGETSMRVEKEVFNTKANPIFESTHTTLKRWEGENIGPHKIMLMGGKKSMDDITGVLQNEFVPALNYYRSNDRLIEIAPKSASKLSAVKSILGPEESLENVLAFGDNYNDMELLQQAGYGVAVENARIEVKKIAKMVTLSNKENGVAKFIKDHL
ncbi:Pyridoxal phosphate phosphatase YbhA [Flagellimonas maritima]|uniref:Pyridoxal phosphate phosphatase YbhA n=1 Tax=Flagellimonas maritima TaxID=1383885 RepID=A0A2Z4LVE1_9FLAO|nr:HAD family hydrolase [Allomuricauda aurantiaca]AWX45484.1 Pyridoxal phosphate phosphatase YbhA [Allomuricauda aurantiaca]